jgi:hypothetical protein
MSSRLLNEATESPVLLQGCMAHAVSLSKSMIQNLISKALVSLQDQTAKTMDLGLRLANEEGLLLLERQRSIWFERFPAILQVALDASLHDSGAAQPVSGRKLDEPLRLNALELMDDSQVQERIQTARMQQSTMLVCELELAELDAMSSAALGLKNVAPARNPFKPLVFINTLNALIEESPASPPTRIMWAQHLGSALGQELKVIYRQLITKLSEQGIQAASYRVTPASNSASSYRPSSLRKAADAEGGRHVRQDQLASTKSENRVTLEQLHSMLSARKPLAHQQMPARSKDVEDIADLVQDLEEIKDLVQILSMQEAATERHTKTETHDAGVAAEVVHMLVGNLQSHPRLLGRVRDWVNALEEPLQLLAQHDVAFLRNPSHPVRIMLDQVIQRSLGFSSESMTGFQEFFTPVRRFTQALHERRDINAQIFQEALHDIQHVWMSADKQRQLAKEQAVQALLQAEQRNKLAKRLSFELLRRPDAANAPIFIKQFLAEPWAQVLASAKLHPTEPNDAIRYEEVVADLLWSTAPDLPSHDRKRLIRLIPQMLVTLKTGLKTIDFRGAQIDHFLVDLMKAHEQALHAKPVRRAQTQTTIPTRKELEKQFEIQDHAVWVAPAEARDSGFMDSEMEDIAPTVPMAFEPELNTLAKAHAAADDDLLAISQISTIGVWVDLEKGREFVRAQLTWISPQGTLFMFTSVTGEPYSMTLRSMNVLLAQGKMRVIESSNIVANALDALAQKALQNTVNLHSGN